MGKKAVEVCVTSVLDGNEHMHLGQLTDKDEADYGMFDDIRYYERPFPDHEVLKLYQVRFGTSIFVLLGKIHGIYWEVFQKNICLK